MMKQPTTRPGNSRNRPLFTVSRAVLERAVRLLSVEGRLRFPGWPDSQRIRLPAGFGIDYSKIDHGMRGIIRWLNANGYPTICCCIGSQTVEQLRRDQHNRVGYIAFCRPLPGKIRARAAQMGLCATCNESHAYAVRAYPNDFKEDLAPAYRVSANRRFPNAIRRLFGIPAA